MGESESAEVTLHDVGRAAKSAKKLLSQVYDVTPPEHLREEADYFDQLNDPALIARRKRDAFIYEIAPDLVQKHEAGNKYYDGFLNVLALEPLLAFPQWFENEEGKSLTREMLTANLDHLKPMQLHAILKAFDRAQEDADNNNWKLSSKDKKHPGVELNPFRGNKLTVLRMLSSEAFGYAPLSEKNAIHSKVLKLQSGKLLYRIARFYMNDSRYPRERNESRLKLESRRLLGGDLYSKLQERVFELSTIIGMRKKLGQSEQDTGAVNPQSRMKKKEVEGMYAIARIVDAVTQVIAKGELGDKKMVRELARKALSISEPSGFSQEELEEQGIISYIGFNLYNEWVTNQDMVIAKARKYGWEDLK